MPHSTRAPGKLGTFNTLETHSVDQAADSADALTSAATLKQMSRFRKYGACNYQNVDLFKIPDPLNIKGKQRKQRTMRLSQIENYTTHATLTADRLEQSSLPGGASTGFQLGAARSENIGEIYL